MQEDNLSFKILDDEGNVMECEALFTFENEKTGKKYIAYTDHSLDEAGNTMVYASVYDDLSEMGRLSAVETEEEWEVIQNILKELQKAKRGEE